MGAVRQEVQKVRAVAVGGSAACRPSRTPGRGIAAVSAACRTGCRAATSGGASACSPGLGLRQHIWALRVRQFRDRSQRRQVVIPSRPNCAPTRVNMGNGWSAGASGRTTESGRRRRQADDGATTRRCWRAGPARPDRPRLCCGVSLRIRPLRSALLVRMGRAATPPQGSCDTGCVGALRARQVHRLIPVGVIDRPDCLTHCEIRFL